MKCFLVVLNSSIHHCDECGSDKMSTVEAESPEEAVKQFAVTNRIEGSYNYQVFELVCEFYTHCRVVPVYEVTRMERKETQNNV